MMAEIINLRRARKARTKSQKEEQAAQNRLLFGLSKTERESSAALRDKDKRQLDAHQLTPDAAAGSKPSDDGELS